MSSSRLKVHFLGIGGIGVSALAQYYLAQGHQVTGSDLVSSEIIDFLKKKGIKITLGKNIIPKKIDLVIYSPAIKIDRLKTEVPLLSYPQALGQLTKEYFTIAISGTHGKSTVTAMASLLLKKAGLDPTVIIGTKLKEFNKTNCRVGRSQYLVIEADEHLASFLNYWPKIIVVTNIEADHLDYYKNIKNIKKAFNQFVSHLPQEGILIKGKENRIGQGGSFKVLNYDAQKSDFLKLKKILKVPGDHNLLNALAALTLARSLKIPDQVSFKSLAEYRGCWRRFEETSFKINDSKVKIIFDYAHHPTEIEATLKAVQEKYPRKKIWCLFQPHQYQRTYYLLKDFIKVFQKNNLAKVIITDIYDVSGREEKGIKKKINAKKLVKLIDREPVIYLKKEKMVGFLKENLKGKEIIIIMGAGDIYQLFKSVLDNNKK